MKTTRYFIWFWVLGVGMVRALGQDYLVAPVPASLNADANTTFMVDLTQPKTQADSAVGNALLNVDLSKFSSGSGYAGALTFNTAGNFPTNAWTVEMVMRLPYANAGLDPIVLGQWTSASLSFTYQLVLQKGNGVRLRMYCPDSTVNFYVQPYAGGNGRSIQASAVDKWVYVAFGCDFVAQQCSAAAREVTGAILNQDMYFAPTAWMDTTFLNGLSASQQATALTNSWMAARNRFAQSMPASFSLGNAAVQIQRVRISNRFRSEIFQVAPLLAQSGSNCWPAVSLDPARVRTQSVQRTVGYPGYNNFRTMTVDESYLPLSPGGSGLSLGLTDLGPGLYSLFVYGAVDPSGRTNLSRVWKPCPVEFEALDASGGRLASGRMLLKQSLVPRRMQGFHFHVNQTGNVTASFRLPANAQETAWIQKIALVNPLQDLPDVAIKSSQNLANGASAQLTALSEARKARDEEIWNTLPPLNTHLQVHDQVAAFKSPPSGLVLDTWATKAIVTTPSYYQYKSTFDPLDFTNVTSGGVFPQSNILAQVPWPGSYPDDGAGIYFDRSLYPSLTTYSLYNTPRAILLGYRYYLFYEALANDPGTSAGLKLPLNYFQSGDPNVGHDGAMALVRWAYDWPALEMSLHEIRLCTHSPDLEYNTDWSSESVRNGKMYYEGWSGAGAVLLLTAYDQLFPYINGNQVFADAVHRFIPWVNTPQDVIRFLDRYLVFSSVRDFRRGLIRAASVEDVAGTVLGPHPLTSELFDLTKQYAEIYPCSGTFQEMYGTALSRSGVYYIGSYLVYAFGGAQELVTKAYLQKRARQAGVSLSMDLSDVSKYPKVAGAGNFLLDMWVGGGFPFMTGDASGGPHTSYREAQQRLVVAKDAVNQFFDLTGSARHARVLQQFCGDSRSEVAAAAAAVDDPIAHAQSRVVPDYGAILELNPGEADVRRKTAMTLRLGIGQGHAHNDYLDLNLFAMGVPLAVDLACRDEGGNWSRPTANWSFLHNHALAHDSDDPKGAGSQTGEPWLRAFAPPLIRASYVDQNGATRLDRDVVLMEVGSSGSFYAFDVQRLRGGTYHTWAFHGCESEALQLNVPTQSQTVRWVDRTLEGTHRVGSSSNLLQATWTMTRKTKAFTYTYNGGGVIDTVGCEPTVLGTNYDATLPEINVRATLLGRGSDAVFQGNPYSDVYSYCFPFLWVQATNETESVYPAVYEWYRGTNPVISAAELLSLNPLRVRVTTTAGQVDSYEFTSNSCLAASWATNGLRWFKLSGSAEVVLPNITLHPGPDYDVVIASIDYTLRRLTTSAPLPDNPQVTAGNGGRQVFLKLRGSGTSFTWDDDLLVQEGQVTSLKMTGLSSMTICSNQPVLFGGMGNRKVEALTSTTEDGLWHFRNGVVINKPAGQDLSSSVFTDANGDGYVNVKTYEIGVGDHLTLPADVTIQYRGDVWRIQSNVRLAGDLEGTALALEAAADWQEVAVSPEAPRNVRVLPR